MLVCLDPQNVSGLCYQFQKNYICCTSQHKHPSRNGVASGTGNLFAPRGAGVMFDQKPRSNLQWELWGINPLWQWLPHLSPLARESGKWSISFCLYFSTEVTLFARTHMSPSSVGERWQVGPQSFKLLTPLCTHFHSVTLCGWSSVLHSLLGQTGWICVPIQLSTISLMGRLPHCYLQPCWDRGTGRGNSLSPEEESHHWDSSPGGTCGILFLLLPGPQEINRDHPVLCLCI